MKNNLPCLFSLLLIAVIISSCSKDRVSAPGPLPTGTFGGYLEAYHLNPRTNKRDTTYEWVILTLSGANGFTIIGDTTVHAGSTSIQANSHGSYALNSFQYMQFSDKTLPAIAGANTASSSKYSLNGLYIYAYNGTYFSLIGLSSDTLMVSYNLSPLLPKD